MSKKLNRENLIEDFERVQRAFKKGNHYGTVSRNYYRKHGKFTEDEYATVFGDFKGFKSAYMDYSGEDFDIDKKMLIMEEEIRSLKKDKERLLKLNIEEENIIDLFRDAMESDIKANVNNEIIDIEDDEERVAVLELSDWHIGELVSPQFVNGVNEYNEKICIQRLDDVFNVCLGYCRRFNITRLHLLINGDIISGGIHNELVRNMWINEVEQVFFTQDYFIKKLEYMSEFFNEINVDVIVGNHSRILPGKPYYKEKVHMNFEYILGRNIQSYFNMLREKGYNSKITVDVPESPFKVANINGTRFLQTHGDILTGSGSGGFAGIPFYSICMSASKLYGVLHQINLDRDVQFDHILMGHLHTSTKIPLFNGGFCWVNGCGIGTNEFSLSKMKSVAKKEQLMLIIDRKGRIELEKNITFE